MKEIKTFETAIKQNAKSLEELGINATLFWAYRTSKETGNELIDFNEVILDYDIVEIAQALRANGITEFTISSTFSSLLKPFAAFEKTRHQHGWPTTVKARYTDWKPASMPHSCNPNDGKGGINHVERRNNRNSKERRRIQKRKILGQAF